MAEAKFKKAEFFGGILSEFRLFKTNFFGGPPFFIFQ
jgi:hypothetical protein